MKSKMFFTVLMIAAFLIGFIISTTVYTTVYTSFRNSEIKVQKQIDELKDWQNEVEKNGINIK